MGPVVSVSRENVVRHRARRDIIHAEIVTALRAVGASVQDLAAVGGGVPDILVGYRGINYLMEIKTPKHTTKAGTAERQLEWHQSWRGSAHYVRSIDEAYKVIGVAR